MNIIAFTNDTGSRQWRLDSIANYVNSRTKHEMYVTSHKNWKEDTLGADIIIAQMWRNPKGVDICHKQGAKVVYEADDIVLGVGGQKRSTLMDMNPEEEKMTIETIKKCDLVTVTTETLAKHYRQFHSNVVVLPNYLDYMWWGKPMEVKSRGKIRLGWMGSLSHKEDLEMIAPVLKRIIDKYDFVKFVHCGAGGKVDIYGEDLFSQLPPQNREHVFGVPIEFWPVKSKTLGFDIGIAPLLDDEFNSGKSAIKYYEYAANGVPGVYSDTVVYRDTVKHAQTGFLAKNEDEWFKYLEKLILNEDIRREIAIDAYKHVFEEYNLDDHYMKWVEEYQKCLT